MGIKRSIRFGVAFSGCVLAPLATLGAVAHVNGGQCDLRLGAPCLYGGRRLVRSVCCGAHIRSHCGARPRRLASPSCFLRRFDIVVSSGRVLDFPWLLKTKLSGQVLGFPAFWGGSVLDYESASDLLAPISKSDLGF